MNNTKLSISVWCAGGALTTAWSAETPKTILHHMLQQRLQQQFPGHESQLLYFLLRLVILPGTLRKSNDKQDRQHRRLLERCLKEYQRLAFGQGKDRQLALKLRNDARIAPHSMVRAQRNKLGNSRDANERLIMEAMLHKTLDNHHASIKLEHGTAMLSRLLCPSCHECTTCNCIACRCDTMLLLCSICCPCRSR